MDMKKVFFGVASVVIIIGIIVGMRYLNSVKAYQKSVKELKIGSVDLSKISDGEYTGSCNVDYISAKVVVTVKNHKIENINLVEHKNGRGKRAEVITDKVVGSQSLQVDTVSGATNSSKVILKAIENALEHNKA
ncbi:FMN-binding protein [Clostridium sp. C2-6-12]|uniref:FMN-binding protein n=1 Tax=Clostridium sp. C2-6-12 TaxID=2698832 RepID=UPI001FAC4A75|nr:FMN-binding protein [Clostridium sp. C2-6-12]